MLYRPAYCCHCGEAIERVNWKFWTSRRFCQLCETEFVLEDWLPRMLLGINVVLGIFFIGSFFQPPERSLNKIPNNSINCSQAKTGLAGTKPGHGAGEGRDGGGANPHDQRDSQINRQPETPSSSLIQETPAEKGKVQQNKKTEPVYFCGAETKKGTPCSRRVKGGGRCWQHKGKEALLPDEKLLVTK